MRRARGIREDFVNWATIVRNTTIAIGVSIVICAMVYLATRLTVFEM
jgi:hypothetical protein